VDGTTESEREYRALIKGMFRALAPFYDAPLVFTGGMRRAVADLAGPIEPGLPVLDVATGTGRQALELQRRGGRVTGVDFTPEMLAVARRKVAREGVALQLADATRLPFGDGVFGLATVNFALHEMPPDVRERVVREMVRVTRPGGRLLVSDYQAPPGRARRALLTGAIRIYESKYYRVFIGEDLAETLERAGVRVEERRPLLFGAAVAVRGVKRG